MAIASRLFSGWNPTKAAGNDGDGSDNVVKSSRVQTRFFPRRPEANIPVEAGPFHLVIAILITLRFQPMIFQTDWSVRSHDETRDQKGIPALL
jgi:hypothetical protein